MAIIVEGKTKCEICNKVLDCSREIVGFPPFVSNMKDRLYKFSDKGFHLECLLNDPLSKELEEALNLYNIKVLSINEKIDVTGHVVKDLRKLITVGFLTTDKLEELYKYNFLSISKDNLSLWEDRKNFLNTARKFVSDGKWESFNGSNILNELISELEL